MQKTQRCENIKTFHAKNPAVRKHKNVSCKKRSGVQTMKRFKKRSGVKTMKRFRFYQIEVSFLFSFWCFLSFSFLTIEVSFLFLNILFSFERSPCFFLEKIYDHVSIVSCFCTLCFSFDAMICFKFCFCH